MPALGMAPVAIADGMERLHGLLRVCALKVGLLRRGRVRGRLRRESPFPGALRCAGRRLVIKSIPAGSTGGRGLEASRRLFLALAFPSQALGTFKGTPRRHSWSPCHLTRVLRRQKLTQPRALCGCCFYFLRNSWVCTSILESPTGRPISGVVSGIQYQGWGRRTIGNGPAAIYHQAGAKKKATLIPTQNITYMGAKLVKSIIFA